MATTQRNKNESNDEPRYVNGVKTPEQCRFCGSENMTGSANWTKVNRHSHNGEYVTVLKCRDCGGAFVTTERGNKRVTTMADRTLVSQRWRIPEGYVMSICSDCGEAAGWHALDEDRRLLEFIRDGEITTTCCSARGEFARDSFDVPLGGA